MTFGPGRPAKEPMVLGTRDLDEGEAEHTPRGRGQVIKTLRDSHHMIARLCALGLGTNEVAYRTGYSVTRVSTLRSAPAVQELIAYYRDLGTQSYLSATEEYYSFVNANRNISARMLNDKLTTLEPEDFSVQQLVAIHADSADRTGFPKRSVAVNVNLDFAAALDRAIARSSSVVSPPTLHADSEGPEKGAAHPLLAPPPLD